jgi:hypothetical protein
MAGPVAFRVPDTPERGALPKPAAVNARTAARETRRRCARPPTTFTRMQRRQGIEGQIQRRAQKAIVPREGSETTPVAKVRRLPAMLEDHAPWDMQRRVNRGEVQTKHRVHDRNTRSASPMRETSMRTLSLAGWAVSCADLVGWSEVPARCAAWFDRCDCCRGECREAIHEPWGWSG